MGTTLNLLAQVGNAEALGMANNPRGASFCLGPKCRLERNLDCRGAK